LTSLDVDEDDFIVLTKDTIREKILFILGHYPRLSPSMLQVGIGTGIPSKLWRIVFRELLVDGRIKQEVFAVRMPNGRDQTIKIVSLVDDAATNSPNA